MYNLHRFSERFAYFSQQPFFLPKIHVLCVALLFSPLLVDDDRIGIILMVVALDGNTSVKLARLRHPILRLQNCEERFLCLIAFKFHARNNSVDHFSLLTYVPTIYPLSRLFGSMIVSIYVFVVPIYSIVYCVVHCR